VRREFVRKGSRLGEEEKKAWTFLTGYRLKLGLLPGKVF
jgi:hypothetical protein